MDARAADLPLAAAAPAPARATFGTIAAVSVCHGLNDLVQSLVPALYPILKSAYALDFAQVGLITLAFYLTASLLQPIVGIVTDRHPLPFSLPAGMAVSLCGLVLLATAASYPLILLAACLIGIGSSIFHPEASRVARLASGGRHGIAQSLFQVGGNFGQAIGPLLVALVVVPRGQASVLWFSLAALLAMGILVQVGRWYRERIRTAGGTKRGERAGTGLSRGRVRATVAILVVLVFSKHVYTAGLTVFHTFYLIDRFGVSVQGAQIALFVFLASVALGTVLGGPLSDRFGAKAVIWASILGALPFTIALPHAGLTGTIILTVPIGLIVGMATPQIVVFAQDLLPGRTGLVSGLFLGLAFGSSGIGAAALGELADRTSIVFVYQVCAWLPAIGLVAAFLPDLGRQTAPARRPT